MGMEGPPGSQGPQGETGTCPDSCNSIPGPPGIPGLTGPAGGRGLPGVKGDKGNKGMMGDPGHNGRPGDPGKNGPKGDQGEQGVCECTDGVDGTDGIPGAKGAKGDKGDTGTMGVKGTMGLKGNMGVMGLMGPPGPCSPAIQSAFCASLKDSFPTPNWPVPFPIVIINLQGHFNNPILGMYTAPVNGTYVFTYNLFVKSKPLKVGLFVNFQPVCKTTHASHESTASKTIVIHLTMGDRVWLQVKDSHTNGMYVDYESSSTFCGYLLHPDSCEMPMGRDIALGQDPLPTGYSWGTTTTATPTSTTPPQ